MGLVDIHAIRTIEIEIVRRVSGEEEHCFGASVGQILEDAMAAGMRVQPQEDHPRYVNIY